MIGDGQVRVKQRVRREEKRAICWIDGDGCFSVENRRNPLSFFLSCSLALSIIHSFVHSVKETEEEEEESMMGGRAVCYHSNHNTGVMHTMRWNKYADGPEEKERGHGAPALSLSLLSFVLMDGRWCAFTNYPSPNPILVSCAIFMLFSPHCLLALLLSKLAILLLLHWTGADRALLV